MVGSSIVGVVSIVRRPGVPSYASGSRRTMWRFDYDENASAPVSPPSALAEITDTSNGGERPSWEAFDSLGRCAVILPDSVEGLDVPFATPRLLLVLLWGRIIKWHETAACPPFGDASDGKVPGRRIPTEPGDMPYLTYASKS